MVVGLRGLEITLAGEPTIIRMVEAESVQVGMTCDPKMI